MPEGVNAHATRLAGLTFFPSTDVWEFFTLFHRVEELSRLIGLEFGWWGITVTGEAIAIASVMEAAPL
jgi:hypothetical protein